MSSDGSRTTTSSKFNQFGLYRNIDERTEEFLRLSRKRQIRQGCACAAVSTAITVTVVVTVLLVYEYSITTDSTTTTRQKPSRKSNWVHLFNETSSFNKGKLGIDPNTLKMLPIIVKALNNQNFLEKFVDDNKPDPEKRSTTEVVFRKNVFADSKNWMKKLGRVNSFEYKNTPTFFKHRMVPFDLYNKYNKKVNSLQSLSMFDKTVDQFTTMSIPDNMTVRSIKSAANEPVDITTTTTMKPDYTTINVDNASREPHNFSNLKCKCPKNLSVLINKLFASLHDILPSYIDKACKEESTTPREILDVKPKFEIQKLTPSTSTIAPIFEKKAYFIQSQINKTAKSVTKGTILIPSTMATTTKTTATTTTTTAASTTTTTATTESNYFTTEAMNRNVKESSEINKEELNNNSEAHTTDNIRLQLMRDNEVQLGSAVKDFINFYIKSVIEKENKNKAQQHDDMYKARRRTISNFLNTQTTTTKPPSLEAPPFTKKHVTTPMRNSDNKRMKTLTLVTDIPEYPYYRRPLLSLPISKINDNSLKVLSQERIMHPFADKTTQTTVPAYTRDKPIKIISLDEEISKPMLQESQLPQEADETTTMITKQVALVQALHSDTRKDLIITPRPIAKLKQIDDFTTQRLPSSLDDITTQKPSPSVPKSKDFHNLFSLKKKSDVIIPRLKFDGRLRNIGNQETTTGNEALTAANIGDTTTLQYKHVEDTTATEYDLTIEDYEHLMPIASVTGSPPKKQKYQITPIKNKNKQLEIPNPQRQKKNSILISMLPNSRPTYLKINRNGWRLDDHMEN